MAAEDEKKFQFQSQFSEMLWAATENLRTGN